MEQSFASVGAGQVSGEE